MSLDFNKLHMQNKAVQLFVALGLAAVLVVAGYFAAFQSQWEEYQVAQQQLGNHRARSVFEGRE